MSSSLQHHVYAKLDFSTGQNQLFLFVYLFVCFSASLVLYLGSMAHLTNPLVSPEQLASCARINDALPQSAQDLIRFSTGRLTQSAGILLRLPQSVSAQAVVVLYRYWTVEELARDEFKVTTLHPCE